jgi:hypothetical protein
MTGLIQLVVMLIAFGAGLAGLWALNAHVPMAEPIKTVVNIALTFVGLLIVLSVLGLVPAR